MNNLCNEFNRICQVIVNLICSWIAMGWQKTHHINSRPETSNFVTE